MLTFPSNKAQPRRDYLSDKLDKGVRGKMTGLLQRMRNLPERLHFKYTPRLVDSIVAAATTRARAKLRSSGAISILVDNTVFNHAVTHETGWISTGAKSWGSQTVETGYSARIPVYAADNNSREYANVCYLPGIAKLHREGLIKLATSAELQDEQFRQPSGRYRGYGYFDYSLFGNLQIDSLDGFVLPTIGPAYFRLPSSKEQQRQRIDAHRSIPAFDMLATTLGPSNSQDAWHIHTAETHSCFCFLTMDFKLLRTIEAQSNSAAFRNLRTKVMTPEMLGKALSIPRIPPHLFSYHNASFFVRSDLSMPGNRRRSVKSYK